MNMRIAIIGAGMAGIGTLRYYIDHIKENIEVFVFDDKDSAGVGYPFGEDDRALLLNQRLKKMTLVPWDDKKEYVKYLKKYHPESLHKDFISRTEFGEYTNDVFQEYIKDERVKFIPKLVDNIEVVENGFKLFVKDEIFFVDAVHLCIGQLPQSDIYKLSHIDDYIRTPFPIKNHEKKLLNSKSVGIIGTNLTSLDIIMYLYKHNYKNNIIVTSRSGIPPLIRGNEVDINITTNQWLKDKENPTIQNFLDALNYEAKKHGVDFELIKKLNNMSVLDSLEYQLEHLDTLGMLQEITNALAEPLRTNWNKLPQQDRIYYMTRLKGIMGQLTGPFPEETAVKITDMIRDGQLKYLADVEDIIYKEKVFVIETKDDKEETDIMVSAVGPSMSGVNLADENNASPLVKCLIDNRIFTRDELGGIMVTYPEFSVISQPYGVLNRMKLYGNLVSTTHISNSGVNLILSKIPYTIDEMIFNFKNQ